MGVCVTEFVGFELLVTIRIDGELLVFGCFDATDVVLTFVIEFGIFELIIELVPL